MDFVKNINADRGNTDAFTEKLWMGIQNGDKDCYEKLFNEYSDKMLAYGMKYGSSDISSDSFLKRKTAEQIVYLNCDQQMYSYEQQFSISCLGSLYPQMHS